MTYRWDDEEEKTIQINNTTLEQEIDAIKGLHTLTVITVDEENNTDTKVQKINGVSKPKVSVTTDDSKSYFIIKASDDEKLSKFISQVEEYNKDESHQHKVKIAYGFYYSNKEEFDEIWKKADALMYEKKKQMKN